MQQDSLKQNKNTSNDPKWKSPYSDKKGLESSLLSWQKYPNQNNI